jgi:hypothetical protein
LLINGPLSAEVINENSPVAGKRKEIEGRGQKTVIGDQ